MQIPSNGIVLWTDPRPLPALASGKGEEGVGKRSSIGSQTSLRQPALMVRVL